MTLGEKIREARRKCGLSQERLAEKMSVSRSAIAKWETDKGLPDVGNLKILARLLNASVDQLLDDTAAEDSVIREPIHLGAYGYGCKKVRKDRAVREKYPDAAIYPLLGQQEPDRMEMPGENPGSCCGSLLDRGKNGDKAFYLIERDGRQFVVTVTDAFLETRPLEEPLRGSSFHIDGWNLIKCNYEIEA